MASSISSAALVKSSAARAWWTASAESPVVAVPPAAVVERDEEQVRPLESFEGRPRVAAARHRRAQRRRQPVQDRGLQEERPDLIGLPVQDLIDEVVDDEAVVAGKMVDEGSRVVATLERQRRELQRGDPPFRPGFEGLHVRGAQAQAHRVVEV
jgi:hypothetical protein